MLGYVLTQAGNKVGLNKDIPTQRSVLLRFANEAAVELYQTSDMAGSLQEQYFNVNSNQTIAMPDYVGQIRAMRRADSQIAIKLSQQRPRYNQFNWSDEYNDWRLKGSEPLQVSIRNQAQVTFVVKAVEDDPIIVTITGSSDGSSQVSESITMTSVSMSTTHAFDEIHSITKTKVSVYDVQVLDTDGKQISYLANNKLECKFQIVDISTCPWFPPNTNPLLSWVEVLFKKALPWYQNDSDEFPAVGYDNVWVNKILQLWYEEQGNVNAAIAYSTKATQSLAAIHEDNNRGTDDVVSMVSNPHDRLQGRVGFGRDYWYAYRISGR